MNYQKILDTIHRDITPTLNQGRVADYIPALADVPLTKFGMALYTVSGETYQVGDAAESFSIQSISKLFACALAFQLLGEDLWHRVGREPSGTAFNSLVQLEYEGGKPRNPFVNAGALIVTDILCSRFVQSEMTLAQLLRHLSANPAVDYNMNVASSERVQAHRNTAMAHFMKSFGNFHNPVDTVIDAYCRQCAIEMNCVDLARAVSFLANGGIVPWSGEHILDSSSAKRLSALMLTCGTYDAAGDFVFRVGLPAKSGIGGGIVAVLPGEMGVCVWSPGLDRSGNSLAGVQALEWLTTLTQRSIF
ncbi:MAG: glutaminase [Gammaproteobacteria bacterium]|nr:glutaminase [Gammaproteobacteria bacterium]